MSKIRFRSVYFSSEDNGYPAEELNVHSPNTRGWQSVKFAEYPQELGFELIQGEHRLSQIQVLSHQSKISSKIEIYVGTGSSYHTATFKRLGYLSLDSNERSSFQARELKTVYIDHVGKYVKLLLQKNYVNKQNLFNQVGIVAMNLLGSEEKFIGNNNMYHSNVNDLRSGAKESSVTGYRQPSYNPLNDLTIDMNLDPITASKIRILAEAKAKAIATEDFSMAKQIKIVEAELKSLGSRLAQLDVAKKQAIDDEDYDRAKDVKDEVDELRKVIEEKIKAINIPGVTDKRDEIPRFAQEKSSRRDDDYGYEDMDDVQAKQGPPLNFDDMPAVAGARGGLEIDSGRKDDYDDDGSDRPIKPKGRSTYDDIDPVIDETEQAIYQDEENFPPGQHPLEGVPNVRDLPNPEDLSGKSKDISDQSGITNLIGEYRARCLFSKTWALREGAIMKTQQLLTSKFEDNPGLASCLPTICTVLRVGVEDKMQQVLLGAVTFLDEILSASRRAKITRSVLSPLMDPVISNLIEKLADGNHRIREGSRKGLEALINSSSNVGPMVVGAHAIRPLPAKQKTAWRPLLARLQLLTDLVANHGLGNNTGLSMDTVMSFVKANGAFTHSNGEVRDAARELTVAVQKYVGTTALDPYLKALRPNQLSEYLAEFEGHTPNPHEKHPVNSHGYGHNEAKKVSPQKDMSKGTPSSPRQKHHSNNHVGHSPAGKVNTSAQNAKDRSAIDESQDFTSCMFCGASDRAWNEDSLDLHYWKDCPLLAPCPACAQVVEIAGLPEHLLDECEQKANFTSCTVTGLAIRNNEFEKWKKSPNCKPAPANCMYCPLCYKAVEDSDDAWKNHLCQSCTKNSRTK